MNFSPCYIALIGAALTCACSQRNPAASPIGAQRTPATNPPFHIIASIEDLMDAEVDPAADALWDSVAIVTTASGTEYRQPHTDAEWEAVRHSALVLSEASNLLIMQDRPVAAATDARARAPGELPAIQIQQHIVADRAAFEQFAHSLQLTALNALKAIDSKDASALMDVGAALDGVCEACHVVYWYPNLQGQRTP